MTWKVYASALPVPAEDGTVIELDCGTVETEDQARLRAMRLYESGAGRIMVRCPTARC